MKPPEKAATATIKGLPLLKSQEEALRDRAAQALVNEGYELIYKHSFMDDGLFSKAEYVATAWIRIRGTKDSATVRLNNWLNEWKGVTSLFNLNMLRVSIPLVELDTLKRLARSEHSCGNKVVQSDRIFSRLASEGGADGIESILKILKFHSDSCHKAKAARALISVGHAAEVEEYLPSAPASLRERLNALLLGE